MPTGEAAGEPGRQAGRRVSCIKVRENGQVIDNLTARRVTLDPGGSHEGGQCVNDTFACPGCGTELAAGTARCPSCGIRLTGEDAVRLWHLHQRIDALQGEADTLLARLRDPAPQPRVEHRVASSAQGPRPDSSGAPAEAAAGAPAVDSEAPVIPPMVLSPTDRPSGPTGQQILLGLGALLLLSAATVFVVVVWVVVGLAGQAAIMATATLAAAAGSLAAGRRRLPAAAETGAVVATGLLVIDTVAAYGLDVAGLQRIDPASYATIASLVVAVLLAGCSALASTQATPGEPVRSIRTYGFAAVAAFTSTPWFLLTRADPHGTWLTVALLGVAVADATAAWWSARTRLPLTAVVPALGGGAAVLGFLGSGFADAYAVTATSGDPVVDTRRVVAFLLMTAGPVLLAVASTRVGRTVLSDTTRAALPGWAAAWAVPVVGVLLVDAPWPVLTGLSVVASAYVAATLARPPRRTGPSRVRTAWSTVAARTAVVTQPVLFCTAAVMVLTRSDSPRVALGHLGFLGDVAETFRAHHELTVTPTVTWLVVAAGVLWMGTAGYAAWTRRSPGMLVAAEVAVVLCLTVALENAGALTWTVAATVAVAVNVGVAAVVNRSPRAAAQPTTRRTRAVGLEAVAVLFGIGWGGAALLTSLVASTSTSGWTLVALGVLTLLYATSPGRLPAAYLGSPVISAGTWVLATESGIDAIEAATVPLAVLLAGVGAVQWARNHAAPSMATMGPPLSVLAGPTFVVGLAGDQTRLVVVSAAAVVALIVGLVLRLKAPVTVASVALVIVAVTQGGPLIAYVPSWVLLGAAGAVLLAAGVAWERAVVTGRRTTAWYGALR